MTTAHGVRNQALDALEHDARVMFRVFGPRVTASEDETFAIRRCDTCSPPDHHYRCYICTFTCEDQWRYDLHVRINPETCQRYAAKWANRYASMD